MWYAITGFLKWVLIIIFGLSLLIGLISSCVSCSSQFRAKSRNRKSIQTQQVQQTQRSDSIRAVPTDSQSSRLDVLTGIYTGTRTTPRGPVGWTMMVFKNNTR